MVIYPQGQPATIERVQRLLQRQPRRTQPTLDAVAVALLLLLFHQPRFTMHFFKSFMLTDLRPWQTLREKVQFSVLPQTRRRCLIHSRFYSPKPSFGMTEAPVLLVLPFCALHCLLRQRLFPEDLDGLQCLTDIAPSRGVVDDAHPEREYPVQQRR